MFEALKNRFIWIAMGIAMLVAQTGCVMDGTSGIAYEPLEGSCKIDDDQQGTFMARVSDFAVPILVDDRFSDSERQSIQQAVDTWNRFGEELIRKPFFGIQSDVKIAGVPNCNSPSAASDDSVLLIREGSMAEWNALPQNGSSPTGSSVGITYRCIAGGIAHRQVTLLNMTIIAPTQVSSVVLHELGHALGLDHSCGLGADRPDFRSCFGLSPAHPYHQAVMFPTLEMMSDGSGIAEVKDALQANDEARMRCLYGPQ